MRNNHTYVYITEGGSYTMAKTFKFSLVAITALSTLSGALSSVSAASLQEAIEDVQISNLTIMRYTSKTGLGDAASTASGSRFKLVSYLNLLTQSYGGFQGGLGFYYNQGSSMPFAKGSNSAHNDLLGNGGSHLGGEGVIANLNVFGISEAFLSAKTEDSKYTTKMGITYIRTPFTDPGADRGVGLVVQRKAGSTTLVGAMYDSWIALDVSFMYGLAKDKKANGDKSKLSTITDAQMSFKNNLYYVGLEKTAPEDGGFDLKLYVWGIKRIVDASAYLELGYNIGDFRLGTQVAYTYFGTLNGSPFASNYDSVPNMRGNALRNMYEPRSKGVDKSDRINPEKLLAGDAGLYNVQASYKASSFNFKTGFTGSFGQSYGALIDNQGQFNLGGVVWHNMLIYGGNGASMFGTGGVKNTNIMVGYAKFVVSPTKKINVGFDVAYVSGNNNLSGDDNNFTKKTQNNNNTQFVEFTPSLTYKLNERFTFTGWYGQTVGDMKLSIARAELKFVF